MHFVKHVCINIDNKENIPDVKLHVIYRSPNSSEENNQKLIEYINCVPENSVIVGDFNLPEINWNTLSASGGIESTSHKFLTVTQDKFLLQHVDFPTNYTTRKDGTITKTCIDLMLTNKPELIGSVRSLGHLGASKHVILEAELILPCTQNASEELVPDYQRANFHTIRDNLSAVDWNILNNYNTEESWEHFKEKVTAIIDSGVPKKRRRWSNRPLWMKQNTIRVIRKKRRLWKWYYTTRDYNDYQSYLKYAATASKVVKRAKKDLERKLAKAAKSNPKPFYKYINNSTKVKSKVGPLRNSEGKLLVEDHEIVQELNDTFGQAFTVEDLSSLPNPKERFHGATPLSSIQITDENVLQKLKKLNPNK